MAAVAPLVQRLEDRFAASRVATVCAIVAASALLRIVFLLQAQGPLLHLHRSPASDMHFNHVFAQAIAAGDLLVDRPLHPLHPWHEDLARQVGAGDAGAARQLWDRWYGGRTFHQEPLYAYLLAASYALFGPDPRVLLLLQLAMGVAGNVLVYVVARRCFGDFVGAVAGALATLCGPLLYYDLLLLRDAMVAMVGMGLVLLSQRALERATTGRWAALGAALGVALCLKSSFALLFGVVLAGLLWSRRREGRALLVRAGALLAAAALLLSPVVARNVAVGAPPFALSSVGAITFIGANTADYGRDGGLVGDFFVSPVHAAAIMGRSDGRFLPAVIETLRTHEGPASLVRQWLAKLAAILWWYEIPNNASFDYFALHAPVLRWLPVDFLVIGPMALLGLGMAAPRIRRLWPLYGLVATSLVVLLAFGVFSRLRLPLLAALIPFAALCGARLVDWSASRQAAPLAAALMGLALLGAFAARDLPEGQPRIRPSDYSAAYVAFHGPAVDEAYRRGDPCTAAGLYAASLRYEPEAVRRLAGGEDATYPHELQLAQVFRKVHHRHAAALEACRRANPDPSAQARLQREIEAARRRVAGLDMALRAHPPAAAPPQGAGAP